MTTALAQFLSQYGGQGLLLDTNLLLVLVIGYSDHFLITKHKTTAGIYEIRDFALIYDLFAYFRVRVTTPHVLTEVSNLLGQSRGPLKDVFFQSFSDVIGQLGEHHLPSQGLAGHNQFAKFGLTDLGILDLATREKCLVVTADSRLADFLGRVGIDVIDFQWIQELDES